MCIRDRLNRLLLILYTALAPRRAINIVTGTNTANPNKFMYPKLKGELTLSIILPLVIIVTVPVTEIKKPTAAAVPIDFLIS